MKSFLGHIPFCGCVFSPCTNAECEQNKAVDLIKWGITKEMNSWHQPMSFWRYVGTKARVFCSGRHFQAQMTEKLSPIHKLILNMELNKAPLSQSHPEFSFVFTKQHDTQTAHTHNRDKDSARMRVLGEATDNIFTGEHQGVKIVHSGSVLLIVHSTAFFFI